MNLSSKLLENAVDAFAMLPGIGKKTALRLALHLLQMETEDVEAFSKAFVDLKKHLKFCKKCHNIADGDLCSVCAAPKRDQSVVCVVEGIKDVLAIENTQHFNGAYHVLGGVISPIEGIGPNDLNIDSLVERVKSGEVKEMIMALSPTIEGDTTIYYISKQIKELEVQISTIARGVSFGGELEYADELTLGRSIVSRIPYKNE